MSTLTAAPVEIHVDAHTLSADLQVPPEAVGLVVLAHVGGDKRVSTQDRHVADYLDRQGFATLVLDLLTSREEAIDARTMQYRFDVARLGWRVGAAAGWARRQPLVRGLPVGCFGTGMGAGAALVAAAERPEVISAIVSCGARLDLSASALPLVEAPTLLVVGGEDGAALDANRDAMRRMRAYVELEIVPRAPHFFEEPGTLAQVERVAARWFARYLRRPSAGAHTRSLPKL